MLLPIVKEAEPTRMTTTARPRRAPRRNSVLEKLVLEALDEMKAVNIKLLDVRGLTDIADAMIVASGTSDRHVKAIADRVIERACATGRRPMGVEGQRDGEWVLVDLQDLLLHVMLPRVREFYAIEQLWEAVPKTGGPKTGGKATSGAPKAKRKATNPAQRRTRTGAPRGASPRSAAQ
jgi:ribosome-associated protein